MSQAASHAHAETIAFRDGRVVIIDQTLLPNEERYIDIESLDAMWEAIRVLRVRGAPAIGVAAAFGLWLGVRGSSASDWEGFRADLAKADGHLRTSRPTAVNLFWALDRMMETAEAARELPVERLKEHLLAEARAIRDEDEAMCRRIGELGQELLPEGARVLTHCNAGGLATARYGTALAPVFVAHERGRKVSVFADETRPLLQGARLTAWELMRAGIDVTVICDNMAASVLRSGKIDLVIVGADRIAANGDAANKIGTYGVALAAKAHDIPFYVAAPTSTVDLSLATGEEIPIEERPAHEIAEGFGRRTAPEGVKVFNPAFDVTPADLIAGIITEHGICRAPYGDSLAEAVAQARSGRASAR
jgi:methylthioribose-1-phosphate isomerase